jgi:Nuclease-related domain
VVRVVAVRVVELSNHPADEVQRTEDAIARERRALIEHSQAVDRLRAERTASRRWWQLGQRIRDRRDVRDLQARRPRRDPGKPHQLAQQRAGVAAEDEATSNLSVLSDEWTLVRGYANRRGELDHLLVGPRGVWAIEVKGRGIRVHVNGDRWSFEKFDRYGNLVDQGTLADRGGRGWGRQVTDIAGDLERFLRSRGAAVTVETAVVVMHNRAEIGSCVDLEISVLSIGTKELLKEIFDKPILIDNGRLKQISHLIRRDHNFHAQRKTQRHTR